MNSDSRATLQALIEKWRRRALDLVNSDVMPKSAGSVQREECRRAFYAGVYASFLLAIAATQPESEDECEAQLQALQDEMEAMAKDLRMT